MKTSEVSAACQVKLLRVLQEGTIRPVGARSEMHVDARVVTATNRNLALEMQAGRFREDLFYRIAVLAINTPPLRKRISDIPLLVDHFLCEAEKRSKCSRKRKIEKEAIKVLANFPWPGNVRQLRHVVEKLVATTIDGDLITAEAARRALPDGQLAEARAQVPLCIMRTIHLKRFSIEPFFLSMSNCLRRREITVKLLDCYGLIEPPYINAWNAPVEEQAVATHNSPLSFWKIYLD